MATISIIRKRNKMSTSFVLFLVFFASGYGDRIKQKIYIDLDTQSACFRIFNSTHEIGCTSAEKGNVGTVHYIQDESDFDWILSKGPHDPYIALFDAVNFTGDNIHRIHKSSRANGILVIALDGSQPIGPEDGFSTQDKCPNDRYGLYSNDFKYKECRQGEWNVHGTSLGRININIPVFTLTTKEDVHNVLYKCFYPFNRDAKTKSTYPVCAAEVKARMDGAVNSVTCTRRSNILQLSLSPAVSFCDPLGDKNVVATMMEEDKPVQRKENSVVVVATKLDATSLFINEYHAADTVVASMVTLLASAEALWKVKDNIKKVDGAKDIMYTFFQGETFDYIGSSRMVYDMTQGDFPPGSSDASYKRLPKVSLADISQIIELNQVGRRDEGSLWAHIDPLGQTKVDGAEVQQMIADLKSFGKDMNVSIDEADKDLPLPPASSQSFLKERLDIPTVVITDHKKAYTNKYYNSRLDMARFINADDYPPNSDASVKYDYVTRQAELISNLSTTLAQYLYKASTGKVPDDELKQNLTADSSTITHLLYCFLISPNCELFLETVDESNVKSLTTAKRPFPFYVSVMNIHTNEVTQLVYSLLARFTGEKVDLAKGDCKPSSKEKRFSYTWMQGALRPGSKDERDGWCVQSTAFYSVAKSPAFDIDGYDVSSNKYSMWTESVWSAQAIGVRLFLVPSNELQVRLLITGILLFLISLPIVYFLSSRSHILFCPQNLRNGEQVSYNPML